MSISFDSALGIHTKALEIYSRRAELLASNLANSDTPGYKARDIDFKSALNASVNSSSIASKAYSTQSPDRLDRTNKNHLQIPMQDHLSISTGAMQAMYREPNQASLDGNTVDTQVEKAAFAENAMRYEASLTFLSGKFKGMIAAIKGG